MRKLSTLLLLLLVAMWVIPAQADQTISATHTWYLNHSNGTTPVTASNVTVIVGSTENLTRIPITFRGIFSPSGNYQNDVTAFYNHNTKKLYIPEGQNVYTSGIYMWSTDANFSGDTGYNLVGGAIPCTVSGKRITIDNNIMLAGSNGYVSGQTVYLCSNDVITLSEAIDVDGSGSGSGGGNTGGGDLSNISGTETDYRTDGEEKVSQVTVEIDGNYLKINNFYGHNNYLDGTITWTSDTEGTIEFEPQPIDQVTATTLNYNGYNLTFQYMWALAGNGTSIDYEEIVEGGNTYYDYPNMTGTIDLSEGLITIGSWCVVLATEAENNENLYFYDIDGNYYVFTQTVVEFEPISTTVEAPTFSPDGGTFTDVANVTVTSTTSGATIHYTINGGAEQTVENGGTIAMTQNGTITAWAVKGNATSEQVTSQVYTILPSAPVINPNGGTFEGATEVTLTCGNSAATIWYMIDDEDPVQVNSGATITISKSCTVTAWAELGEELSDEVTATFTISLAAPVIDPNGGTFKGSKVVTITCANSDATIWYMIDDGDPEEIANGGSITITKSCTITAWSELGNDMSDEVTATFVIQEACTLAWLAENGVNGQEYTIVSDVAIANYHAIDNNNTDFFITDCAGNWMKLEYYDSNRSRSTQFRRRNGISGSEEQTRLFTVTFRRENGNPIISYPGSLQAPDNVTNLSYSIREFDLADEEQDFDPKPWEVINFRGVYFAEENRFRAYSGEADGVRGRSVEIDLTYAPDATFEDGGYYYFNVDENGAEGGAVIRLKEAWTGNGAPRRVGSDDPLAFQNYVLMPLKTPDISTGITVNKIGKPVESVRYYNVAGMQSEQPFEGVNIVVTRYTDGTTSTAKVVR